MPRLRQIRFQRIVSERQYRIRETFPFTARFPCVDDYE
jgi:hypothetical protein